MPGQSEKQPRRVAVIGAGMAGLAGAYDLARRGFAVTVLEKSNGLGGRLAVRALAGGGAADHGAQYVTARSDGFRHVVAESGALEWHPRGADGTESWWIGQPGMSSLVQPLTAGLDIRTGLTVARVEQAAAGVQILDAAGQVILAADAALVAVPAPQAAVLTGIEPDRVEMAPCWTLIARYAGPVGLAADVMRLPVPDLAWLCRQQSRRAAGLSDSAGEDWVIHAAADWSQRHLDLSPAAAAERLLPLCPPELQQPVQVEAKLWRHALVRRPLGRPCLPQGRIVLAGDWCLAPRVEAAYESGRAAAAYLRGLLRREEDGRTAAD